MQAPLSYIRDYYESVEAKNARFPEAAAFWLGWLGHVDGDSVLNAGCGPMLYDNLTRFSRPPKLYVGADLNAASFEFMESAEHAGLRAGKALAAAEGVAVETLAGDIFEHEARLAGRFDTVLGVGFFATFSGARLDALLELTRRALKPGGRLVTLTWRGPARSAEAAADKLKYRYDAETEPTPEQFGAAVEARGFRLRPDGRRIHQADPAQIGYASIEGCVFEAA